MDGNKAAFSNSSGEKWTGAKFFIALQFIPIPTYQGKRSAMVKDWRGFSDGELMTTPSLLIHS